MTSENLRKSFSKLCQLLSRRDRIVFGLLLVGMIGSAILEVLSIGAVPMFVALAIHPEAVLQYAPAQGLLELLGVTDARSLVVAGCLAMLALFLLKTAYNCLLVYARVCFTQQRGRQLSERLFQAYMHAPYEFHLGRNSSELIRNTQHEAPAVFEGVLNPALEMGLSCLMTLAIVILLGVMEPLMALLAILIMGGGGFGYQWHVHARMKAHGKRAQRLRKTLLQTLQQGFGSLKEARILGREGHFVRSLGVHLQRMIRTERFSRVVAGITAPYMGLVAVAGLLCITMLLLLLGRELETIAPTLALFAAALVRLRTSVTELVGSLTALRYGSVAIDPVYDDLKLLEPLARRSLPPVRSQPNRFPLHGDLVLAGVSYRYPNTGDDALRNVSLRIPYGQAVAFIGPTGAGKTTIIDVILGLLRPQRGTVMVNGRDIHANLPAWHRAIGYVPQFIYLTDDTIRSNIALGLDEPRIDNAWLEQAVQAAHLSEFIDRLPEGLDTVVGEQGVRLSGGQRQRIGIARALYHKPDVLIMDEATSALDHTTEQSVIEAVNELKGARTILMIAHRLTTVRHCDRLYRLKDGRIDAVASYEEIIDQRATLRPALS